MAGMPGQVTLSDVAREAGVSLATASRALNGSANRTVGEDLRKRVQAAAARLRYSPDGIAQAMARGRTTSLGLVVPDIADPYYAAITAGVAEAADLAGLTLTLASTGGDAAREVEIVRQLERQRARGVVLAGGRAGADGDEPVRAALESFRGIGGSVAAVGGDALGVNSVVLAHRDGAADLARALHERGYRRFAVLGGPGDHAATAERRDGFLDALTALGAPVPAARVLSAAATRDGGNEAMTRLLAAGLDDVDAVFAVTDTMAAGALAAAHAAGVRVPDDVALAGFDGVEVLQDVLPGLTTVRLPLARIGQEVTRLALRPAAAEAELVPVAGEVVLRGSTPGLPGR